MKIGIDIRSLMDRQYSGVSWCTLFLLEEILRQDKINEYILFYNSGRDIAERLPKFDQANVRIVATHYPNKLFNYFLQKIFRWPKIDEIMGGVDVFWSPHFNFTALSEKTRHILTVHDLSFLLTPDFFSVRKNFWHRLLNVPKIMNQADVIVAISENTKRDIVRLTGINGNKIKVINDGVGKGIHQVDKNDENLRTVKIKYNLPDRFILYLGTIEPRKNILGLIGAFEAIADLPELAGYELVIAGSQGWKNSQIYQAIENSKFRGRIRMIGYLDDKEKIYYYNLCSFFCYPSFYEGFGLPVLEAMACGAAVIAGNSSSLPEVAGEAALLVDANDERAIAAALADFARDDKLRRAYSVRGLERAKSFGWDKAAAEYIKIINLS
jgi:glycosyltransferase involved in cell wall biosynthesis